MRFIPKFLSDVKTGERLIYRGHANISWELKPSIGRHFTGDWQNVLEREQTALNEFKKRSVPYVKYRPDADIEWLCLMQHHGCATRLLDFTTNPLIALFFASDPSEDDDGEVIVAQYRRAYANVRNENLFDRKNSFAYYPSHITERIVGQNGCFVYSHRPNQPLSEKQLTGYTVPNKRKPQVRAELSTLGITYSSLFPGLDGLCSDLNDALVFDLEFEEILS
jgi:hypothetical protein